MRDSVKLIAVIVAATLALCACDNAARIRGEIDLPGSAEPECALTLHEAEGGREIDGPLRVGRKFEQTFIFGPEADYYVTVGCRGYAGQYRSENLRLGGKEAYLKGVDLGLVGLSSTGSPTSVHGDR